MYLCLFIGGKYSSQNGDSSDKKDEIASGVESVEGYWPDEGVVSSENIAIQIAEVVWQEIYGDSIYSRQPFVAEFDEGAGCWYVHGTLPEGVIGGVPEMKINKNDGKVLYINHGK